MGSKPQQCYSEIRVFTEISQHMFFVLHQHSYRFDFSQAALLEDIQCGHSVEFNLEPTVVHEEIIHPRDAAGCNGGRERLTKIY